VPTAHAVSKIARSFSEEALRTLVSIMRDAELPGVVRLKAAEAVPNRGLGLPAVAVDITIQRLMAKRLVELSVDELRQLEQHLAEQAIDITPSAETASATGN
jgi:endonuclease III